MGHQTVICPQFCPVLVQKTLIESRHLFFFIILKTDETNLCYTAIATCSIVLETVGIDTVYSA